MASIDAIINRQLLRWELERKKAEEEKVTRPPAPRVVTVSRQAGSRGAYFASCLAEELGYQLLHREMIEAICESSGYRKRIIESLDTRFLSDLELLVESLITGQAVDHTDYHRHLFRVVLSMARLGGVVVVGRGSNFILGPLRGFHIRVIAPLQQRIANLVKYTHIDEKQAASEVATADLERKGLIAKLFGADINDPGHYDLVFNFAFVDPQEVIQPTIAAIRAKFERLTSSDPD